LVCAKIAIQDATYVMIHKRDKCVRKIHKELKETKFLSNAILIMIDGIKKSSKLRKKVLTLVG